MFMLTYLQIHGREGKICQLVLCCLFGIVEDSFVLFFLIIIYFLFL